MVSLNGFGRRFATALKIASNMAALPPLDQVDVNKSENIVIKDSFLPIFVDIYFRSSVCILTLRNVRSYSSSHAFLDLFK